MNEDQHFDILVVDDEAQIADLIADFLRDEGYAVGVAYDGTSALERAGRHWPKLLITDVRMPRIDGYELALRVRQTIGDVYAIFMSALSQGLPPPPFGVILPKPFDFERLLALVRQAVCQQPSSVPAGLPS